MDLLSGLAEPTASAVLSDAHEIRRLERELGATKLIRAAEWCDVHPADEDDEGAWPEWSPSLPRIAWDAPAEFAAAFGQKTDVGCDLLHRTLELRHRLPRVWRLVLAGELDGWRALRIAEATIAHPDDVAEAVDIVASPIAHKVGEVTLQRLITEARIRLHPEEVERESRERLDERYVKVYDEMSHGGVMRVEIRADLKDVYDFNQTVAAIAAALANDPDVPESLDIRRSMAIGIIADPVQAAALLNRMPEQSASPAASPTGVAKPRKSLQLHVHVSEMAVNGAAPVASMEYADRVVLADLVREWCGRTDTHVTVQPVIDLADHMSTDSYHAPDRLKTQTELKHPTCQFPWCTRPAWRCDKDHSVPFDDGGTTCSCNLVPLCRRHHRLKTLTLWNYHVVEPGVFVWRAPHGRQYLRDPSGTTDLGPTPDIRVRAGDRTTAGDRSPPWRGCFHPDDSLVDRNDPDPELVQAGA